MNRILTPLLLTLLLPACSEHDLAQRVIDPPNKTPFTLTPALPLKNARQLLIPVGPPNATLAAWVLEPTTGQPPRATILLLHGIIANHYQLRKTAAALTSAGFRAVLPDLRGHGQSTGDFISYGYFESRDLLQLTNFLEEEKLLTPNLGVYGVSYGAATALQYAALDPRVQAVVAVAPFSTLREEAPHFAKQPIAFPGILMNRDQINRTLDLAGTIAGFNPDDVSPLAAIQKTNAPILLIHGTSDLINPYPQSLALHNAAKNHSELLLLPHTGHLALAFETNPAVIKTTTTFFQNHFPLP